MSQKTPGGGGPPADHTVTPFRDVNAETAQRRIADDLRHARVARGIDVADAARSLRIRAAYLSALEDGRFADLPGPTYVAGFLRAYGRYLELDGDELVRRYKDETGGMLARQRLNFPVPASEARHPTGLMIVAALIVAVAIAAAWYVMAERDRAAVELVPAVPDSIAEAASAAAAESETAAVTDMTGVAAQDAADGVAVDDTSADAMIGEAPADAEDLADGTTIGNVAAETDIVADEDLAADAAGTEAVAADESGSLAASEAELEVQDGYVPRVYGLTNEDSRVEVRAVAETWIQVEGPDNEMLLTRVLQPGDIYRVPNRNDVTLDTGNAGGLEVRVDGALIAPLGEVGVVVRNISLAPDQLLAR